MTLLQGLIYIIFHSSFPTDWEYFINKLHNASEEAKAAKMDIQQSVHHIGNKFLNAVGNSSSAKFSYKLAPNL